MVSKETLRQCNFLNDLPDSVLDTISQHAQSITVPAATDLFDNGDPSDKLVLVLSGSIRVYKRSESGREVSLYRVNKDKLCIVTLGCLLGGEDYPAAGYTEEDSVLITIPRGLFLELVATTPQFRTKTFHQFADRVSGLMALVDEISFRKLDQRLASYLINNAPVIKASHQSIADELGSVREIISRLLKSFEKEGWVELSRGEINVISPESLENKIIA